MSPRLFKFLGENSVGPFSSVRWPKPGEWLAVQGPLVACATGLHVCRIEDLPYWINEELWEVESDGATLETARKLVVERARLSTRIAWWPETGRDLAADCARELGRLAAREIELVGESHDLNVDRGLDEIAASAKALAERLRPRGPARAKQMLGLLTDAITYATDKTSTPAAAARHTALAAAFAADRASRREGDRLKPGVTPYRIERRRQAKWFAHSLGVSDAVSA